LLALPPFTEKERIKLYKYVILRSICIYILRVYIFNSKKIKGEGRGREMYA
jgi:hypothetical protein